MGKSQMIENQLPKYGNKIATYFLPAMVENILAKERPTGQNNVIYTPAA